MTAKNNFQLVLFALALALTPVLADNVYIDNSEEGETQQNDSAGTDAGGKTETEYDGDRVGSIDPSKTKEIEARKESKQFGAAGFGPAWLQDSDNGLYYNFFAGRIWEVNPFAAIKTLGQITTNFEDAVLVDLNLGANFYAMDTDISPYIGGGLGFGYGGGMEMDNAVGFNLGASVGVLFFRTSSTQLNVEAKTSVLLKDGDNGYPRMFGLGLGVLF